MKIAAAYVRVSTESQDEYSPASQLKLIQEYAKKNDFVVPSEFVFQDIGISGRKAENRPDFMRMIGLAKQSPPPFEAIIVWKFSRLFRNQEQSLVFRNMLRRNGVSVTSISEPSSDSPYSSLVESILAWVDEFYSINLAQEVRRGMTEKARRGEVMGTAPFGYTCKDKTLVPNDNADIIKWIFDQWNDGKGARAIAAELNGMGIKTRRGNPIDNRWVTYVLGNPTYIGKIRWSTDGKANYGRTAYNADNVLLVDGKHEPIIDMGTWDNAQERLAQRPTDRYKRKDSKMYMLKGLCRCSSCGATLTLQQDKYMQCHKYARGQCAVSHCLSLKKANAAVIEALESAVENKTYHFSPPRPRRSVPGRDWDKLIAAETERLRRAKNALLDGAFTNEEYKAAKKEIEETISRLKQGKQEEEPQQPDISAMDGRVMGVLDALKADDVPEESKNAALRAILDKIVYEKPQNRLDIYFLG